MFTSTSSTSKNISALISITLVMLLLAACTSKEPSITADQATVEYDLNGRHAAFSDQPGIDALDLLVDMTQREKTMKNPPGRDYNAWEIANIDMSTSQAPCTGNRSSRGPSGNLRN